MSRGPYPIVLMLAMSLPGAARALGLGEIRVDSALNEPLSAQIDILGATRDELMALTAKVANREIFQRYNADRPTFLSSATFKVGVDAEGRPVLNIRSGEAFTDPVISFVVDLRWGKNELVREYSLLLDPAGFNSQRSAAEVALASANRAPAAAPAVTDTPNAATLPAAAVAESARTRTTAAQVSRHTTDPAGDSAEHTRHRIVAGDTLRGIAHRAGARSESQIQRTMIAIFRANTGAFEGNINRLRRGAVLSIPSTAQVAAISAADAKHEVRAQMTAWRLDGRPDAPHRVAAQPAVAAPATAVPSIAAAPASSVAAARSAATAPAVDAAPAVASVGPSGTAAESAPAAKDDDESPNAALKSRVQSLEQALADMHKQLALQNAKLQDLKAAAATPAAVERSVVAPDESTSATNSNAILAAVASPRPLRSGWILGSVAIALSLLLVGFAYVRRRLMRVAPQPVAAAEIESHDETPPNLALDSLSSTYSEDASQPSVVGGAAPVTAAAQPSQVAAASADTDAVPRNALANETTASLEIDTEALERSYIDALAIDIAALETSYLESEGVETDAHDMAPVDTSDVDTAVLKSQSEYDGARSQHFDASQPKQASPSAAPGPPQIKKPDTGKPQSRDPGARPHESRLQPDRPRCHRGTCADAERS